MRHKQAGSILLSLIITLPFLIIITVSYLGLSLNSLNVARADQFQTQAQFAADAGVDMGVKQLNLTEGSWAGVAETNLLNDTADSNIRTTYEVSIQDLGGDKLLTSTGRTYFPSTTTTPRNTVTLSVNLREITSGASSVVTGFGGLIMRNHAKILGGSVSVNGFVQLNNNTQIGQTGTPATLSVANQTCPRSGQPGYPGNYPSLCTAGQNDNPIDIVGSGAIIYADVSANQQSYSNPDNNYMVENGLISNSGVATKELPEHDRNAQIAAVNPAYTQTGNIICQDQSLTWQANKKIQGNVTLRKGCSITVLGDIWITGNLVLDNRDDADMVVGAAVIESPTIMVDGSNGIRSKRGDFVSNSSGIGFTMIAYYCSNFATNNCTDVTGASLITSSSQLTILLENDVEAPNTFFYSRWSTVQLENDGSIGAVAGQTIVMDNHATITFGTEAGESTSYWIIDGYRRTF